MKLTLSLDSIALLLYCSELYFSEEEPLNEKEWDDLEKKIKKSSLKRPAGLLGLDHESIMKLVGIEEKLALKLEKMNHMLNDLMAALFKLEKSEIGIITKYEEEYPVNLKNKLKKKYPMILYYIGNYELLKTPMVYLTGPIKINEKMNNNTKKIVHRMVDEGYTLITSNTRGCEGTALKEQLKSGGKVVEFSCENILTSKKQHAKAIKAGEMLILTARHPFATFDLIKAIDRNQYIYTLSEMGIIVYSSINSGATWLSAIMNINNKYTKLAAVVDDEFYGNARLIELGAYPITMDMIDSDMSLEEMCEDKEEIIEDPIHYDQLSIYDFLQ